MARLDGWPGVTGFRADGENAPKEPADPAGAKADGASAMASSSKTNNTFTQHPPEDFDRTVKIIEDHLAKREPQN